MRVSNTKIPASVVGGDILNLVTTGMYHSPLAIYREYLQNAADAIGSSPKPDEGRVEITIYPAERRVTIQDNGRGLSYLDALRDLIPVARSRKQRGIDRGFRGIGRLSALAFAERVNFYTRSAADQPVTRISWSGAALRARPIQTMQMGQIVQECVEVSDLDEGSWPDHFFEVEIVNVARHAAGLILNREAVRTYIGEVCPVPMAPDFPFTSQIERLFDQDDHPLALQVFLVGDQTPITRRHGPTLRFSEDREDLFSELEALHIPAIDGDGNAAVGWLAHSSYLGAIPKDLGLRGLRAREGNIQIGDEGVFDHLFQEERFNRWCVGEVHIVDPRILPNGRRDYFEQGPHTRNIENHLEAVVRRIVSRCRKSSSKRNQVRKFRATLDQLESAYDLAASGYLKAEDANLLIERTLQQVENLREAFVPKHGHIPQEATRLEHLAAKLRHFRSTPGQPLFGSLRHSEIEAYQRIFRILTELTPSPGAAKEIIEAILSRA